MKGQPQNHLYRSTQPSKEPKRLKELKGIGEALATRIKNDLAEGDEQEALALIKQDPYILTEVDGIAFRKADLIAQEHYAVDRDDPRRHLAGNRFIVAQKGTMSMQDYRVARQTLGLFNGEHAPLGITIEGETVWLPEELQAERGLMRWHQELADLEPQDVQFTPAQEAIMESMTFDAQQKAAIMAALTQPVLLLRGGAGTGKTRIIAGLCKVLSVVGKRARVMAFAGKAADRAREALDAYQAPGEATTIHKALEYRPRQGFTLDCFGEDFVIIDESSMLHNGLLWAVVSRLQPGAHLILVGDEFQLPPIGYGTPFLDLVKLKAPTVFLEQNYRQKDVQGILHMAQGIRGRQRIVPDPQCVEMLLGAEDVSGDFSQLVLDYGGLDFENWQAITWKNKDVQEMNLTAQGLLNPDGDPLADYPCWDLGKDERGRPAVSAEIRRGDKIIIVKNSSNYGVFNGQLGRAVDVVYRPLLVAKKKGKDTQRMGVTHRAEREMVPEGPEVPHLEIEIAKRPIYIPVEEVREYVQLGYCVTVHKAQGSDWDRVIIAQPGTVNKDIARRWYYTAITRAKTKLVVLSSLSRLGWWTNAAADAPEVDSTLVQRIRKAARA